MRWTTLAGGIAAVTLLIGGATVAATPPAPSAPAKTAPVKSTGKTMAWSRVVTTTPMGAHVMGNPNAAVRLVEYVSYTCDHCAEYERASAAPIKARYVEPGRVAVEVRNLVRDPLDMTAATLARCGGPKAFFGHHNAILGAQDQWLGKVRAMPRATIEKWYEGPLPARMQSIARDSGLEALMIGRGMSAATVKACYANPVTQKRLEAMTARAKDVDNIRGTPSFLFNGTLGDEIHDWDAVKSRLDQMLGTV